MSLRSILFSAKSQSVQDCFLRVTEQAGPEKQLIFANTLRATLLTGLDKRDPGKTTYKDLVDELHHIEIGMLDEFRTPAHAKYDDEYCWDSIAKTFFAGASVGFKSPHSNMLMYILDFLVVRCQKNDLAELANKIFMKVALHDQAHDLLKRFVSTHRLNKLDQPKAIENKKAKKKAKKKVKRLKGPYEEKREQLIAKWEKEAKERVAARGTKNISSTEVRNTKVNENTSNDVRSRSGQKRNDKVSRNSFEFRDILILMSVIILLGLFVLWLKGG